MWSAVERFADAVAAVFADDRVAPRFSEGFDRFGDSLKWLERANRGDASQRRFASGVDEAGKRVARGAETPSVLTLEFVNYREFPPTEPNRWRAPSHGQVLTEIVRDHMLHMTVDRVEKRNALVPKLMAELSDALTWLDTDPELWVGVFTFAGDHTTAGLEITLFLGPDAEAPADRGDMVDPYGLERECPNR